MSLMEMLRSARATWYSWRGQKQFYRSGVPGVKYSGYEAGRLARKNALIKKVRKAREKYEAAEARLDEFLEAEAARKAEARKRA